MHVKAKKQTLEALFDADKSALYGIYTHRCLNEELLYFYFYQNQTRKRCQERIQWLSQQGLLLSIDYGADLPALFLSTLGIETLRVLLEMQEKMQTSLRSALPLKKSKELKLSVKNIKHQMTLNEFALQFKVVAKKENVVFHYYDETFIDIYQTVRPDGLLQTHLTDFFIEIDMGTERFAQLLEKWRKYRSFHHTAEFADFEKTVTVLFILYDVKRASHRKQLVLKAAEKEIMDLMDSRFDVIVGTEEEIMKILFEMRIPPAPGHQLLISDLASTLWTTHGFQVSTKGSYIEMAPYDAYVRKVSANKKILVQDGRPQEFILDFYLSGSAYSLKKIACYAQTAAAIYRRCGRVLPYLVVVESPEQILRELQIIQGDELPQIFYTTRTRLETCCIPEALFQFDCLNRMYHFTDYSLKHSVYEDTLRI